MAFCACGDEDPIDPEPMDLAPAQKQIIIVNEGEPGAGNGSISILDVENDLMENSVFEKKNNYSLGDGIQNIHFDGERAYIAVSNTGNVEVVSVDDFSSIQTLAELGRPNDVQVLPGSKLMVSQLQDSDIDIRNLEDGVLIHTLEVECTQPLDQQFNCGNGPLLFLGGEYVYIGNLGSGALLRTKKVGSEIEEEDFLYLAGSPRDMVLDKNGFLWILAVNFVNAESNALYKINLEDFSRVSETLVGHLPPASVSMVINERGDQLYFNEADKITRMSVESVYEARQTICTIAEGAAINSIGLDAEELFLYLADKGNSGGPGEVIKIRIVNGTEAARYDVGVLPSKFYFR